MEDRSREALEAMEHGEAKEEYVPKTKFQRSLAWVAIAVVLLGLGGTIYWMLTFTP